MPLDDDLFDIGDFKLSRGTQIVYVPSHFPIETWDQEVNPTGAQPGFVTSGPTEDGSYFCRYWRWDYDGDEYVPELRTKANSEMTPGDRLVVHESFSHIHVDRELYEIDKPQEVSNE
jgi:hypothetical protein